VRTTIDIPDPLYRKLKGKAASEGRSVKELILRSVEQSWRTVAAEPKAAYHFPLFARSGLARWI